MLFKHYGQVIVEHDLVEVALSRFPDCFKVHFLEKHLFLHTITIPDVIAHVLRACA